MNIFQPHANNPLPTQLVEINTRRQTGTENLQSIMMNMTAAIDLSIYEHPYANEIKSCRPTVCHDLYVAHICHTSMSKIERRVF